MLIATQEQLFGTISIYKNSAGKLDN
jgi:hypothetical protein